MSNQKSCIIPNTNKKLGAIAVFNDNDEDEYKPVNLQLTNDDLITPRNNKDY